MFYHDLNDTKLDSTILGMLTALMNNKQSCWIETRVDKIYVEEILSIGRTAVVVRRQTPSGWKSTFIPHEEIIQITY